MNPVNEHGDMIAITAYYKLQAKVDDLQRQLDNARTDWLCDTCEGRGCEAENQNAVLLAELEEQARLNGKGSERELALRAKVETLERGNAALRKERDSYRFRSEQIWGLRKEIQAALGVPADCEGEEALKRGLESIKALRADKERLDWLAVSDEWFDVPANESFTPDTFRAAIDAARKEQP